jgi:hypothetical protein
MMLSATSASAIKHVLLGLLAAAIAYGLMGAPPGALGSRVMIQSVKWGKIVQALLVGLLVVLADMGLDYIPMGSQF